MSKNPFTIIFGIEPDSMIPRNAEYNQVISDFTSSSPVSSAYVITGVRGCGKTVLMTSIQNHFSKQGDWITLRLNPDLDLYESSISQLSEHISIKSEIITEASVSFAGIGGGVARRSLSDNETLLKKMLIEAKKKTLPIQKRSMKSLLTVCLLVMLQKAIFKTRLPLNQAFLLFY